MEIKEDMNIVTVYASDQIDLAFDEVPDRNWLSVWARTDLPHPFIAVDINKEGIPFHVSALGSLAPKLLELYAEWLREIKASKTDKLDRYIDGDRQVLIDRLSAFYHEQEPMSEEDVRKLQTLVGMVLIDYVTDAEPRDKKLQRLRALYRTALILYEAGLGPRTIRAWLSGSNPDLANRAPLDLLREGKSGVVFEAAKSFAN